MFLVPEHAESVVVAILEKSLEFCVVFLEKSAFEGNDFSLQVHFLDRMFSF